MPDLPHAQPPSGLTSPNTSPARRPFTARFWPCACKTGAKHGSADTAQLQSEWKLHFAQMQEGMPLSTTCAPQRYVSSPPSPQRCGSSPPGQTRSCRTWHCHPAVRPPTECTRRATASCGGSHENMGGCATQRVWQQRQGTTGHATTHANRSNCKGIGPGSHLEALLLQAVGNGGQLLLRISKCRQHCTAQSMANSAGVLTGWPAPCKSFRSMQAE